MVGGLRPIVRPAADGLVSACSSLARALAGVRVSRGRRRAVVDRVVKAPIRSAPLPCLSGAMLRRWRLRFGGLRRFGRFAAVFAGGLCALLPLRFPAVAAPAISLAAGAEGVGGEASARASRRMTRNAALRSIPSRCCVSASSFASRSKMFREWHKSPIGASSGTGAALRCESPRYRSGAASSDASRTTTLSTSDRARSLRQKILQHFIPTIAPALELRNEKPSLSRISSTALLAMTHQHAAVYRRPFPKPVLVRRMVAFAF